MPKALVTVAGAVLAAAGLAIAAPQKDTYNLTANLRARFEVPKPTGVQRARSVSSPGRPSSSSRTNARMTWRLTFSEKLSGRAVAAHVHAGRAGTAGNVLVRSAPRAGAGSAATAGSPMHSFARSS